MRVEITHLKFSTVHQRKVHPLFLFLWTEILDFLKISIFSSVPSQVFFPVTMPILLESNEKCWYWRIPFTGLKNCPRYSFKDLHCHAGYRTAMLVVEDLLTTSSSWPMLSQSHRLYNFLRRANPPSMRHYACPGICIWTLFCCVALSLLATWNVEWHTGFYSGLSSYQHVLLTHNVLPELCFCKAQSNIEITESGPCTLVPSGPIVSFSFTRKFSCFVSPSERTPNIWTFRSVWKYRGPFAANDEECINSDWSQTCNKRICLGNGMCLVTFSHNRCTLSSQPVHVWCVPVSFLLPPTFPPLKLHLKHFFEVFHKWQIHRLKVCLNVFFSFPVLSFLCSCPEAIPWCTCLFLPLKFLSCLGCASTKYHRWR